MIEATFDNVVLKKKASAPDDSSAILRVENETNSYEIVSLGPDITANYLFPGDIVAIRHDSGTHVKHRNENYLIVNEWDVLALLEANMVYRND